MRLTKILQRLLKKTSRSFYLSLRLLPRGAGDVAGLAYLLARAADSIADTELVPPERRLEFLELFRQVLSDPGAASGTIALLNQGLGPFLHGGAEAELLAQLCELFEHYQRLSSEAADAVRVVLLAVTDGMRLDLTHFGATPPGPPLMLETAADLDHYCYCVAGAPGEFWTRLTLQQRPALMTRSLAETLRLAVRFGKGLQMVNVLRDLPADLRRGRCYIPREELAREGLTSRELVEGQAGIRFARIYGTLLSGAWAKLAAAVEYTQAIRWWAARLRCACLVPILIGAATLHRCWQSVREDPDAFLRGRQPVKLRRPEVYRILAQSLLLGWCNAWLRRRLKVFADPCR